MQSSLTADPAFRLFWLARIFAASAFQMASVALGWLVYDRTGSAYALGLVGLCQFVPMVLLTFVIGPIVDRFNRQRIVAGCQLLGGLTLGLLALRAGDPAFDIVLIFVAVTMIGVVRAFEHPSMSALLPMIVSETMLPRALALSSSAMQAATIAGPSIGGLLYAVSPGTALATAALCYVAAAVMMNSISIRPMEQKREPVTMASVFAGARFIWQRPVILGAISLDMFAVLLGGITSLLPIFAKEILHTGPWGLGLLRSAPAVGALSMSFILGTWGLGSQAGRKMFWAVIAFGIATIIFALSDNMLVSLAALTVLGAADNVSVVVRSSLVQLSTPNEMRGRVSAVNSLFIGTSNQLGDFESGMMAGLLGTVPASILGGVGTIAVALAWMKLFPQLANAEITAARTKADAAPHPAPRPESKPEAASNIH